MLENKGFPENKAYIRANLTKYRWSLPHEGEEGYIEEEVTGHVMGLDCQSENLCMQGIGAPWYATLLAKSSTNRQQKWLREKHDKNYFTLKNVFDGKLLTAKSYYKTMILGKEKYSSLLNQLYSKLMLLTVKCCLR